MQRSAAWLLVLPIALATQPGCQSREEKAVELIEAIADVFDKHGDGDCDVLADRLDALLKRDKDALDALAESDSSVESRKRSAKYQARIDKAFASILEDSKKCGARPRVSAVLEKIL